MSSTIVFSSRLAAERLGVQPPLPFTPPPYTLDGGNGRNGEGWYVPKIGWKELENSLVHGRGIYFLFILLNRTKAKSDCQSTAGCKLHAFSPRLAMKCTFLRGSGPLWEGNYLGLVSTYHSVTIIPLPRNTSLMSLSNPWEGRTRLLGRLIIKAIFWKRAVAILQIPQLEDDLRSFAEWDMLRK